MLPIEHDTVISLIDLAKVSITAVTSTGVVAAVGLFFRSKQNKSMKIGLMKELDKRLSALSQTVAELKQQVKHLDNSHKITQDLIVVHADHIKEGNAISSELKARIGSLEATVVRGEGLVEQFNNYLERAKAGTLIEEPIKGSGGLTVIKEEKS